ncbi:MAG: iron chelate uptake ABC transporter family permease subunit [Pseudanabaenaceae cyanobacterium bins.68]|nr:iron chelate uptake ABC transporter family permease subunit [Pseudanabaenaceae cyanobacterium bins.68]
MTLAIGICLGRSLNILNLSDETALGLGISLGWSRLLVGGVASMLAASAVSMAGLIGFTVPNLGCVSPDNYTTGSQGKCD